MMKVEDSKVEISKLTNGNALKIEVCKVELLSLVMNCIVNRNELK